MAVRKSALIGKEVFFDSRFDFHLYDMDFCRTAREKGLCLGTWANQPDSSKSRTIWITALDRKLP